MDSIGLFKACEVATAPVQVNDCQPVGQEATTGDSGLSGAPVVAAALESVEVQYQGNMGCPVTPHVPLPKGGVGRVVAIGVDTLDLGLYVSWDKAYWEEELHPELVRYRNSAALSRGEDGKLWTESPVGPLVMMPGKMGAYRYHVVASDFHLGIQSRHDYSSAPNLYVSINAKTLWTLGVPGAVARVVEAVQFLKGTVDRVQVSRVDLAVDVKCDKEFQFDYLQAAKVSSARAVRPFIQGDTLESYYVGKGGAPIQLRLYHKGLEIIRRNKPWFLAVWGIDDPWNVWRVEFQVRRVALKQLGIDSVDDLLAKLGGLWSRLTTEWLTFRTPGDERTDRRPVEPWWESMQACASQFGPQCQLERLQLAEVTAPVDWYIMHMAGCVKSIAAILRRYDLKEAVGEIAARLIEHWEKRGNFQEEAIALAVRRGLSGGISDSVAPF